MKRHPQFPTSLPFEYRRIGDSSIRTGLVTSLSRWGVTFHCRADISVGMTLAITVLFADGYELSSFDIMARTVWKDLYFERDWSEYKYGAEIIHISESDHEKLHRLLNSLAIDEPRGINGTSPPLSSREAIAC